MTEQTNTLSALLAQANTYATESGVDFNQAEERGSGPARVLPEGPCFLRLIGYVELGKQLRKLQGKPDQTQDQFWLKFAVFGTAPNGETFHTVGEDGVMHPGIITSQSLNLSRNDASTAFKLFRQMTPKQDKQHFAQHLNGCFIGEIKHTKSGDKQYVNLALDSIRPAVQVDPMTGKQTPYPVPEVQNTKLFQLFLWNSPTQEGWDSLYIEGTKPDGTSKNWVQEKIMGALNFAGSPLEQLIGAAGKALPDSLPTLPAQSEAVPAPAVNQALPPMPGMPTMPGM